MMPSAKTHPHTNSCRSAGSLAAQEPEYCLAQEASIPVLAGKLRSFLNLYGKKHMPPVILCIGTDRIIGDSLGPLVGSELQKTGTLPYIYGTLDMPVHALNLAETLVRIKQKHPDHPVVAVDASLGTKADVGSVSVRNQGLHPGAGVSKNLSPAGDISITGITNKEDGSPWLALQTARLSTVMRMAQFIADCILAACAFHSVPSLLSVSDFPSVPGLPSVPGFCSVSGSPSVPVSSK